MTDLRTAAQQALDALEGGADSWQLVGPAIDALKAALAEPALQTCNCRWDGEMQMQQCTLHEAHVDAIKEWAQRAKFAEKKLAALAEQRLTDMEQKMERSIESLKTALTEPEGGGNLPPPLQEPEDFDHAIGADRFKVVRGAFWWHVLIGDSPTEHGKFRSRASAEKMAADLLREFRNGAFVQHEAALAEPVQQGCEHCNQPLYAAVKCRVCGRVTEPAEPVAYWNEDESSLAFKPGRGGRWAALYSEPKPCPTCEALARTVMMDQTGYDTAPPQRKPLTEEEIYSLFRTSGSPTAFARAIERAHEIT